MKLVYIDRTPKSTTLVESKIVTPQKTVELMGGSLQFKVKGVHSMFHLNLQVEEVEDPLEVFQAVLEQSKKSSQPLAQSKSWSSSSHHEVPKLDLFGDE